MATASSDDTFVTLDGLRGFGALVVVLAHSMIFYSGLTSAGPQGPFVVDTFFMLSGFVIAYSYEPRLNKGMPALKFMTQRLVRLYPLYLLGILLGAFVYFTGLGGADTLQPSSRAIQLVPQLFFLPAPNFFGDTRLYTFDLPAWSMFFELTINLVYVLAWPLLRKTYMVVIAVVLGIVGLVATAAVHGSLDAGMRWNTLLGGFARVDFGFFAGVLMYRLSGSPTAPVMRKGWLWVVPWILVPFMLFVPASPQMRPIVDVALSVLFAPLLVWTSMKLKPPKALIPLFTYGGAISYAIYVLHWPLLSVAKRCFWRLSEINPLVPAAAGVGFLVFVVVVSMAAERYYDVPVRRWLNKRLWAKRATAARPAVSHGAVAG